MSSSRWLRWLLFSAVLWPAHAIGAEPPRAATFDRRTGLFEPPVEDLKTAASRGDRAELARVAARLGPWRLARAIGSGDVRLATAALEAIPFLPGGVRLLEPVTRALGTPSLATDAARTLGRLLDADDPDQVVDWEVPMDLLIRACQALARGAAEAAAPLPARLAAVEALAEASQICPRQPAILKLLSDPAAEVRRAAALALANTSEEADALRRTLDDGEPTVAAAAGAAWCRGRRRGAAGRGLAPSAQLRRVALADATPVEDLAEILPCLAASADPDDRKAAERLRKEHGP